MDETPRSVFEKAVALFEGNESALARAAGCSQNAIWSAKRAGRVTAEMAIKIEAATNGKVSRHDLCPKIFGPVPTPSPSEATP